jgi:hypothetical protein
VGKAFMKKLLFVHASKYKVMDGLWAALQILEKDFEITRCNLMGEVKTVENPDFILGWGGFNSPVDIAVQPMKGKKGLCIAGNAFPPTGANNYDVLFYETKWYRPQINFHKNIVQAFGINTDIYNKPEIVTPVIWDYIGVGSFAKWKRWDWFKRVQGNRLVVGEYQMGNESESIEIIRDLIKDDVMVSNMVNPFDLSNFYNWSRVCFIPADTMGGGERAVLEARASGCTVQIAEDNPKLKELLIWDPIPDQHWYASQLKKGILSCL